MTAIIGFVLSSALCGMAWNLESMVVFRLVQGVCGAPLVPLSQAILLDAFPRNRAGQALAIFGLGIMVAPVMGPALGGYLTQTYSWRMVFYINVPHGPVCPAHVDRLFAASKPSRTSRPTGWAWGYWCWPSARCNTCSTRARSAIGSTPASSSSAPSSPCPPAPPFSSEAGTRPTTSSTCRCCKDRNFVAGTLAITAYGISLFGWMAIMPLFSQRLLGYPPGDRRNAVHSARASSAPSPWRSPAASSSACSMPAISSPPASS